MKCAPPQFGHAGHLHSWVIFRARRFDGGRYGKARLHAGLFFFVSFNFLSGSPLRKAANKSNAQSRLFFQKRSPEMEVTGLPRLLQDAGAACSKTAPITQRLGPQLFPKKKAPTREISRGQLDHGWMRPTRVVKKFIADSLGSSAPHTAPRRSCSGTHACRRHWGG